MDSTVVLGCLSSKSDRVVDVIGTTDAPSERQLERITLNVYEGSPFSITYNISCEDFRKGDKFDVKVTQDDNEKTKQLVDFIYKLRKPSCHGRYCIDVDRDENKNVLITFSITNTTKADDQGVYEVGMKVNGRDGKLWKCRGNIAGFSIKVSGQEMETRNKNKNRENTRRKSKNSRRRPKQKEKRPRRKWL
ncbi:uncharacterized protein LOC144440248 isoform X2 [Glandiceps talaboti]